MQLSMRRALARDLPPLPPLPAGYQLQELRPDGTQALAGLLNAAFEVSSWTAERAQLEFLESPAVISTWVISFGEEAAATASSLVVQSGLPNTAYVHYVAGAPNHPGLGLGFIVTLAVLQEFEKLGYGEVFLHTDDFRLPAIKTYLKLGFTPDLTHPSHSERWKAVRARLQAGGRSAKGEEAAVLG